MGFNIITKSRRRSKIDKTLISGLYACSKNGYKMPNENVKFPRSNTRIGCKAMLKVNKLDSGRWIVLDFIKEHNHELSPERGQIFQPHKGIQTGGKNALRNRCASKVRSNKLYSLLSKQSFRRRKALTGKEGHNGAGKEPSFLTAEVIQSIYDYFSQAHLSNPMLFYEVDHDWLQRVRNIIWADAKSRMDCTYFGDVVCFDTSSVSNKNLFPFAPFIGVNHHGQSVLLGCSLILEDTPTSFAWVFKTWLTAMSGRSPAVIITNHDRNVKAAVAEVFPEARHCFSLWNILKKAPRKVGPFCRDYEKFTKEFEKCIYESMTAGEFERRWTELTEEFDLTRNKWLQMLYEDRQQWVPLFLKDTNFAGMSTFESINSFFDSSLSSKATWKEFVEHYETILQNRHEMEALAEFETFHSEPSLTTPSPFEEQLTCLHQ
ncbi:protein FAR-RED IMPAIRED RESPONSE 1-like [Aristolochia californica]|uniref:protein FAR-RED IMPAIRED RESPONSE 1-like n=1 Tax=Aristolochia californica TaxID=171875 RepID=UPI0035E045F4